MTVREGTLSKSFNRFRGLRLPRGAHALSPGSAAVDRDHGGTAWRQARALLAVPETGTRLRPFAGAVLAVCALVGNPDLLPLRAATSGVCRAWRSGGAHSLERGQASGDLRHDGLLSAWGRPLSWRETAPW